MPAKAFAYHGTRGSRAASQSATRSFLRLRAQVRRGCSMHAGAPREDVAKRARRSVMPDIILDGSGEPTPGPRSAAALLAALAATNGGQFVALCPGDRF